MGWCGAWLGGGVDVVGGCLCTFGNDFVGVVVVAAGPFPSAAAVPVVCFGFVLTVAPLALQLAPSLVGAELGWCNFLRVATSAASDSVVVDGGAGGAGDHAITGSG